MGQSPAPILLNIAAVRALLMVSRSSLYRLLDADPTFPRPLYVLGPQSPRWIRSEIESWTAALMRKRKGAEKWQAKR